MQKGAAFLRSVQDERTGFLGPRTAHDFVYDQAIGTHALCEAARGSGDELLERQAQLAVDAILRMQNPGAGWRYDVVPAGYSDTSVTVWMVGALSAARAGGYRVEESAFQGARAWFDSVTDETTGRVGYEAKGNLSSRTAANEKYPRESGEALTAAALWARILCGQRLEEPQLASHLALLVTKPPAYQPGALDRDLYYWYYGTYATFQMGGPAWEAWNQALKGALLAWQSQAGHAHGSFEPDDAWGYAGGRVYSTALAALSLEVYFRYPRFAAR